MAPGPFSRPDGLTRHSATDGGASRVLVKMAALLLADLDGTIIASPSLILPRHSRGQRVPRVFSVLSTWQALIASNDYPPIPEAVAALAELEGVRVEFVTSRGEVLRDATTLWLSRHLPRLEAAPLHLCAGDINKAARISELAQAAGGAVVIDNDQAIAPMLPESCRFFLAPHGWPAAVAALRGWR